jgi:hypothetical protein
MLGIRKLVGPRQMPGARDLLHSIPVEPRTVPCEVATARPHEALRPYVLGYGSFSSGDGAPVRHRLLALNVPALIIDLSGRPRLVTGPRATPMVCPPAMTWATGISVGLAPVGTRELLGTPMSELAGATVPLAGLVLAWEGELADRLQSAPDRPARVAVLDEMPSGQRQGAAAGDEPDRRGHARPRANHQLLRRARRWAPR